MKRTMLATGLVICMIGSASAQSNVEKAKRFRAQPTTSSIEMHAKNHLMGVAAQNFQAAAQVSELRAVITNGNATEIKELGNNFWGDNVSQVKELGGNYWNGNATQIKKLGSGF